MTPVLEKYSKQLLDENVITSEELEGMKKRIWGILETDFAASRDYQPTSAEWVSSTWSGKGGLEFIL
jgi:2-oxoglutarate dehydrogenase E1 component